LVAASGQRKLWDLTPPERPCRCSTSGASKRSQARLRQQSSRTLPGSLAAARCPTFQVYAAPQPEPARTRPCYRWCRPREPAPYPAGLPEQSRAVFHPSFPLLQLWSVESVEDYSVPPWRWRKQAVPPQLSLRAWRQSSPASRLFRPGTALRNLRSEHSRARSWIQPNSHDAPL